MNYTVKRTKSRRMTMKVLQNGTVEVTLPQEASLDEADAFVKKHIRWINNRLKECRDHLQAAHKIQIGNSILFLGKEYPVEYHKTVKRLWDFDGEILHTSFSQSDYLSLTESFYRRQAEDLLLPMAAKYAQCFGYEPLKISINKAKTRWGSCSAQNHLNFSCYLMMAPTEAIEYVIVHELAHIKQHNHSKEFWREVEKCMPDYKQRKALLLQAQSWMHVLKYRNSSNNEKQQKGS